MTTTIMMNHDGSEQGYMHIMFFNPNNVPNQWPFSFSKLFVGGLSWETTEGSFFVCFSLDFIIHYESFY